MFQILKLAVLLSLGYVLYDFVIGLTGERRTLRNVEGITDERPSRQARRSPRFTPIRRVPVEDSTGLHRTQTVGRGVLS